jgi:phenylacetate-CoA ligase
MRLDGIHGRLDDMMIIKGVNVFPSDIETIVRDNANLTGEYVCVITEEKHMAVLTVEVEKSDSYTGDERGLAAEIQNECKKIVGIKPRVSILPAKSIARATHKAKRVRDERKKN